MVVITSCIVPSPLINVLHSDTPSCLQVSQLLQKLYGGKCNKWFTLKTQHVQRPCFESIKHHLLHFRDFCNSCWEGVQTNIWQEAASLSYITPDKSRNEKQYKGLPLSAGFLWWRFNVVFSSSSLHTPFSTLPATWWLIDYHYQAFTKSSTSLCLLPCNHQNTRRDSDSLTWSKMANRWKQRRKIIALNPWEMMVVNSLKKSQGYEIRGSGRS